MAPVDIAAIYRYMRVRKGIRREKLGRIKNTGTNRMLACFRQVYEIHKTFMNKRKQTSLPTNKVDYEELGNLEHSKS
jgi:hypothetical protein